MLKVIIGFGKLIVAIWVIMFMMIFASMAFTNIMLATM